MPNFGPLSAERPELQGLSTDQALTIIRREIRSSVRQIAPPKPPPSLPHKRGHHETGPQLWFEPDCEFNLGRWYQICKTCDDQDTFRFTTKRLKRRLIAGDSELGRLTAVYGEILSFRGDDEGSPASTNSNDDGDDDGNNNNSDSNCYNAAPTPGPSRSIKQKLSGPSSAATRVVKRRQSNSPPLALRRGRRPAPFPIISPLYETFEL